MGLLERTLLRSAANTINKRIVRLSEKFGQSSDVAQTAMLSLLDNVPSENIRYKNGVPQIIKPAKLVGKITVDELRTFRNNIPTLTQLKKEYRAYQKKQHEVDEFSFDSTYEPAETFDEFTNKKSIWDDFLQKMRDSYDVKSPITIDSDIMEIMHQPHKTYDDINKVRDYWREKR